MGRPDVEKIAGEVAAIEDGSDPIFYNLKSGENVSDEDLRMFIFQRL